MPIADMPVEVQHTHLTGLETCEAISRTESSTLFKQPRAMFGLLLLRCDAEIRREDAVSCMRLVAGLFLTGRFPVEPAGAAIEEAEAADHDLERPRCSPPRCSASFMPHPEHVVFDLVFAERCRIGVVVEPAEHFDGSQISLPSPFRHARHQKV